MNAHPQRDRHLDRASSLILVWCLLPVVWIISLSFKGATETAAGSPQFLPEGPDAPELQGHPRQTATSSPRCVNSFGIALDRDRSSRSSSRRSRPTPSPGSTSAASGSCSRWRWRSRCSRWSSLVGPLFDLWRTLGLFDTWPGLIIPYMSFTLPLAIWTLSAFFREIPWEMEQAAQVDGATSWQAFRKVIVPLAAPGVFTAAILTFFFAWNEFVFAISLTSTTQSRTVPAQLSFFIGPDPFNPPYGQLATASVVVTIPIIIIVLLFQRKIVAGLTSGAVKG